MTDALVAAVELGGTKINCAVGTGPHDLRAEAIIPTTDPETTMRAILDFLGSQPGIRAIGIASFGPVCLDPRDPNWGTITTTPKPGWAGVRVAPIIRDALNLPVAFDTDVNGAGLGEYRWGALRDSRVGLYLTIGTGIGGGVIIDGKPLHGRIHPEMGHMMVKRALDDKFPGVCPFHGDCLEGLVAGPAILKRTGRPLNEVAPDSPDRALVIDALGQALATLTLTFSPDRIVIGGGVGKAPFLHAEASAALIRWLNGYADTPDTFVVPPQLGDHAGVSGAIALAQDALAAR